jgi:hypothetical protein
VSTDLGVVGALFVVLVLLAIGCVVLLPFSLRPAIVTGPPWLGGVVVASLSCPWSRPGCSGWPPHPWTGSPRGGRGGPARDGGDGRVADGHRRPPAGGPRAAKAAEGMDLQTSRLDVTTSRAVPPVAATLSAPGLLRGGATLGLLERLATYGTLAIGSPEGIAVVLAIKGLGRFGELKIPAAPERFMIGTFASVLWACACWAVTLAVAA